MLCRHPLDEKKRAYVTPAAVIPLLKLVWKGKDAHATLAEILGDYSLPAAGSDDRPLGEYEGKNLHARLPSLQELQEFTSMQIRLMRKDHLRPLNPTPYKVSVSETLFAFIHDLWMQEMPVAELK